ncbi:glycosyl hydrolase family 18 protein [Photobacterium leiognathi]|uniref:glycosyl hydrolase family 18 protein n=1 Tax=Photobacterium leiognathi TaxID=553611 RepID=UPI002981FB15|nr:glycosyl hydrolase family 18 protein [Photobacterium leiognathi]
MKKNIFTLSILCTSISCAVSAQEAPDLGRDPTTQTVNYVLNTYKTDSHLPKVSSYVSNWGQYGRKFNISKIANGYDRIILSFFGMCGSKVGDPTVTSAVDSLKNICGLAGAKEYEVISTDLWADLATTAGGALNQDDLANAGHPNWDGNDKLAKRWYEGQDRVAGMLGYAKKAKASNPNLHIGFSIGGWSLSEPFSRMAKSAQNRKVFIDSVVNIFKHYPFLDQVDLDWEYPGGGGAEGNSYDAQDGQNYATLIKELRTALNQASLKNVKIAIAAGAPKSKLDAENLKQLVDDGVDIIHLMTYDFFGTGWAEKIDHHTNLMSYSQGEDSNSIDASIKYMTDVLGIDPQKIFIGYANYSRNGAEATISSKSPLIGTYNKSASNVAGSWEKGTNEWYDITTNMARVTAQSGMVFNNPDYKLYTDAIANADFIYNSENHLFMSLDTPRSVFAKAQYVKKHHLGGIFNWMGDYEDGLLLNAAREGLGYKIAEQKINMHNIIYQCGVNINSAEECARLTNIDGGQHASTTANAGNDLTAELKYNIDYMLQGDQSTSKTGKLNYAWSLSKATGLSPNEVEIENANAANPTFKLIKLGNAKAKHIELTFKLTVTDNEGNQSSDTMTYTLQAKNEKPIAIANVDDNSVVGHPFNLIGSQSYDNDGDRLSCQWIQTKGEHIQLNNTSTCDINGISTQNLSNKEQQLTFELTVNDGVSKSSDSVDVSLEANANNNQPPIAVISILGDSVVGGKVKLDGKKSTDDGIVTHYNWSVTLNNNSINVNDLDQPQANFTPQQEGTYRITLTVTDNLGATSSQQQELTVKSASKNTWSPDTIYTGGEHVIFNGNEYVAKWWTRGDEPGTNPVWKLLTDDGTVKDWTSDKVYNTGDKAIYNGITYTAKWWTKGNIPGAEQWGPWTKDD